MDDGLPRASLVLMHASSPDRQDAALRCSALATVLSLAQPHVRDTQLERHRSHGAYVCLGDERICAIQVFDPRSEVAQIELGLPQLLKKADAVLDRGMLGKIRQPLLQLGRFPLAKIGMAAVT